MSEKNTEKTVTWVDLSEIAFFDFDGADAKRLNRHLEPPFKVVFDYTTESYYLIEVPVDE